MLVVVLSMSPDHAHDPVRLLWCWNIFKSLRPAIPAATPRRDRLLAVRAANRRLATLTHYRMLRKQSLTSPALTIKILRTRSASKN